MGQGQSVAVGPCVKFGASCQCIRMHPSHYLISRKCWNTLFVVLHLYAIRKFIGFNRTRPPTDPHPSGASGAAGRSGPSFRSANGRHSATNRQRAYPRVGGLQVRQDRCRDALRPHWANQWRRRRGLPKNARDDPSPCDPEKHAEMASDGAAEILLRLLCCRYHRARTTSCWGARSAPCPSSRG